MLLAQRKTKHPCELTVSSSNFARKEYLCDAFLAGRPSRLNFRMEPRSSERWRGKLGRLFPLDGSCEGRFFRSDERRVGKECVILVDLGVRRIIKQQIMKLSFIIL